MIRRLPAPFFPSGEPTNVIVTIEAIRESLWTSDRRTFFTPATPAAFPGKHFPPEARGLLAQVARHFGLFGEILKIPGRLFNRCVQDGS